LISEHLKGSGFSRNFWDRGTEQLFKLLVSLFFMGEIIVFYDIDGVLKPFGQPIPKGNSELLYDLRGSGVSQNISSGRAYSQAQEALKGSGIDVSIFDNMVLENGFWLATPDGSYCPIDIKHPERFDAVKKTLEGRGFQDRLAEMKFTLFRDQRVERVNGVCYSYNYGCISPIGKISLETGRKPVYFLGNDVRVTIKTPVLSDDESEGHEDHRRILGVISSELASVGLDGVCYLNFNPQGADVSPIHGGEEYPKCVGIEEVLEIDDHPRKTTVIYCGDSTNDASAMEYISERYRGRRGKCFLVGPSNSTEDIRRLLSSSENGVVLNEDASEFGAGFRKFLRDEGLV
jgi:hydroxymethylpyrimidine pyrophosphatase-like HAD family hydrolase